MRLLVVDDSAVVRKMLTAALGKHPGIEIVGSAADVFAALESAKPRKAANRSRARPSGSDRWTRPFDGPSNDTTA